MSDTQSPKEVKGTRSALRIASGAAEDERTAHEAVQAAEVDFSVGPLLKHVPMLTQTSSNTFMWTSFG